MHALLALMDWIENISPDWSNGLVGTFLEKTDSNLSPPSDNRFYNEELDHCFRTYFAELLQEL